jgi:hypothetical protein
MYIVRVMEKSEGEGEGEVVMGCWLPGLFLVCIFSFTIFLPGT